MWTWLACAPDARIDRALENLPAGALALSVESLPAGGAARVTVPAGPTELVVDGGDDHRVFDVPAEGLDLELVGLLPAEEYEVSAGGASVAFLTREPDPEWCPTLDPLVHDPERTSPGWLLLPHDPRLSVGSCTLLVDEALRPRWWWVARDQSIQDAALGPDDTVWLRTVEGDIEVRSRGGTLLRRYATVVGADDLPLPIPSAHHELLPQADGSFWTFGRRVETFEVPTDYGASTSVLSTIDDTVAEHVAADGTLLREIDPLDFLQPGRSGWDALNVQHGGVDFLHANALVPLPDGRVVVSIRNQDVIAMIGADGALQWWFGDPAGWGPGWVEDFLTPIGTPSWPYHSHGLDYDPATGELLVFDNDPDGGSPYTRTIGEKDGRVVSWRVDEAARTVEFVGERERTSTGPLESPIMGDADGSLLAGGHVLGVWAWIRDEGDGPVEELGWGEVVARVVEYDGDDVVLDLRLRVDGAVWSGGGYVFRAERVPAW